MLSIRSDLTRRSTWSDRAHNGRCRAVGLAVAATVIAVVAASSASASSVKLACKAPGARNVDSAGTILCAAPAGKSRAVTGRVLNDAGAPVAATVTITRSAWIIRKGVIGYNVKPVATNVVVAKTDGTFSFVSNPTSRDSFKVEVGVAPELGIVAGAVAQAEVHRQLSLIITKLGGGAVRLTVKGTGPKTVKVQVTTANGYAISGQRAKSLDSKGRVTFRLGARATGTYAVYVVRSALTDLFWASAKPPKFRLVNGR
mgnify:FL=1